MVVDSHGMSGIGGFAGDRHSCNRSNCRKGLATKAMGGDLDEVVLAGNFAGGMSLHRQFQLAGGDAAAIITHPNGTNAAVVECHMNLCGLSVHRIFNQLFNHGCWALDHLASGNLADEKIGKKTNRHDEWAEPTSSSTWQAAGWPRSSVVCRRPGLEPFDSGSPRLAGVTLHQGC